MPTKLDLAVIAAVLAGGLVFIESSHRVDLALPAAAEPAASPTDACASADLRYAANRLAFFEAVMPPGCARASPPPMRRPAARGSGEAYSAASATSVVWPA